MATKPKLRKLRLSGKWRATGLDGGLRIFGARSDETPENTAQPSGP
jgi:hypothetical protein